MRIWVAILPLLLLTGCLPPSQAQLKMEMDLEEMKRRLAKLEVQQADSITAGSATGEAQQRQVAELVAGLDNLRVEIQSVNGRLDDLGQGNQQLNDELELIKDDLGLQLGSMTERLDQLEQAAVSASAAAATGKTVAPPAPAPAPVETAEQLYQRALDLIRKESQFAEGRKLLEEFGQKYPEHELFPNALYWAGEAYYGEKNYEMAILQLQDVISKFPKHSKTPAAMLKQGLAFNALGDVQNARTTMQKLIDDFPDSEQVAAAKKFLEQ